MAEPFREYTRKRRNNICHIYIRQIEVELDGDIVKDVKFTGGCHGNLQAIPRLVQGMTVDEVERRIGGIHCGMKNTSCGDQLAKALREAYNAQQNA